MTGETHGSLVVLRYVGKNSRRQALWRCRCVCGKSVTAAGAAIRSGNTRSCGCAKFYTPEEAEAVFWSRVNKTDECWNWTAAKKQGGYGHMLWRGQYRPAHAIAYELLVGPITAGLELDHRCRNPACVRPAHLEPVTHYENVMRGRSPFASRAKQTHCVRGHEFTPENTYIHKSRGVRICRTCHRTRNRAGGKEELLIIDSRRTRPSM